MNFAVTISDDVMHDPQHYIVVSDRKDGDFLACELNFREFNYKV